MSTHAIWTAAAVMLALDAVLALSLFEWWLLREKR